MNDYSVKAIGIVRSGLKDLSQCPLQENENAPEALIEIFPEYEKGLADIKTGDMLILFTWLHLANRNEMATKPRNDPDAALTGVFSTRSPNRPNPVGIHFVKVISVVSNNKFSISGIEVLDKTPVIDIKPQI